MGDWPENTPLEHTEESLFTYSVFVRPLTRKEVKEKLHQKKT